MRSASSSTRWISSRSSYEAEPICPAAVDVIPSCEFSNISPLEGLPAGDTGIVLTLD